VWTLLAEGMAWAVIGRGTWGVTARLSVAFRRPIPVGRGIRAEGWVMDESRRAHRAAGQVLDSATGEVLATAEATFIAVPPAEVERLKARYGMRRLPEALLDGADGDLTGSDGDLTDRVDAGGAPTRRP